MRKFLALFAALFLCGAALCGCGGNGGNGGGHVTEKEPEWVQEQPDYVKDNLSAGGFVKGKIGDFSKYVGTDEYRVVTTPEEFLTAVVDAKYHYKNVWDDATSTYSQVPADDYTEDNFKGKVHVIEVANDLNLGWFKLSAEAKESGVVKQAKNYDAKKQYYTMSPMVEENGISQVMIETTSDLLIYSKSGAKITHAGFKLTSDTNVVIRNLHFDEIWQWEDASSTATSAVGDYDAFDWAYFKIAFCGYIWIDHCTFGKSYDGQIDYSNPVYDLNASVAFRAPYGADGGNGLHISWCRFNAGSADENGYIYQMMSSIEENYKSGGTKYLYYNKLRSSGVPFEDILYGLAIPQKKGFLCGDSGDPYEYNLKLKVSFANCTFKNLEDRIPKLRGGNAYIYNCLVDNQQYCEYRAKLKAANAASLVASLNGGWKCALTSQGIVCGNGGSVKAENCIFLGIETLLKNNDKAQGSNPVKGGYALINCSYLRSAYDEICEGSTTDAVNPFPAAQGDLSTENFVWHTQDGSQPFEISAIELSKLNYCLEDTNFGAGTKSGLKALLYKSVCGA